VSRTSAPEEMATAASRGARHALSMRCTQTRCDVDGCLTLGLSGGIHAYPGAYEGQRSVQCPRATWSRGCCPEERVIWGCGRGARGPCALLRHGAARGRDTASLGAALLGKAGTPAGRVQPRVSHGTIGGGLYTVDGGLEDVAYGDTHP
jgi:hypothetical protein